MSDFDLEYLEVGDSFEGSPFEQGYFISSILTAGGTVKINGNRVTITSLPKPEKAPEPVVEETSEPVVEEAPEPVVEEAPEPVVAEAPKPRRRKFVPAPVVENPTETVEE